MMTTHSQDEPTNGSEHGANDDNKVGYGNPPGHSTFRAGNTFSKGRKKGSKGLKRIVNEAFGMKVKGSLGGKPTKLTKIEATIHQVATKASQGDQKAADKAIPLYERYGPQDDQEGPSPERVAANVDALVAYAAMKRQIDGSEEENDGD
jgi:hypothetical protein